MDAQGSCPHLILVCCWLHTAACTAQAVSTAQAWHAAPQQQLRPSARPRHGPELWNADAQAFQASLLAAALAELSLSQGCAAGSPFLCLATAAAAAHCVEQFAEAGEQWGDVGEERREPEAEPGNQARAEMLG